MPNLGEKVLVVRTPSGEIKTLRNQVCQCTGPLTAVSKLVDADNFVGFSSAGSFILNLRAGSIDWLERKDDCFEMELEVVSHSEALPLLKRAGVPGLPSGA